jgi:hypothetical protein
VGLYEDAVALALSFDGDLAASIARQPEGDEALSRKLWLAIARHLIGAEPGALGSSSFGSGGFGGGGSEGGASPKVGPTLTWTD